MAILQTSGKWNPFTDEKLKALMQLLAERHPDEKVLIFTQYADTVRYLENELQRRGLAKIAGVTGQTPDPTSLVWRFSPVSNNKCKEIAPEQWVPHSFLHTRGRPGIPGATTWSDRFLQVSWGLPQQEQEELEISTEAQKGLVHMTGEAF